MRTKCAPLTGDQQEWLDQVEELGEDSGYFEPLGPDHSAILSEGSATLLVTFESILDIRSEAPDALPLGMRLSESKGWSSLCLLAHGNTWFRHRAIYEYFDRLVDDGFFEEYDHVVFYGVGMCGYAAAAYSVAAPGATVIAISPQATLNPRITEWDDRFTGMRREDFTSRYGFAPHMIEAAAHAYVLYDPEMQLDAMHAALFDGSNVSRLRCRHMSDQIDKALVTMGILDPLLEKAAGGTLTEAYFFALYRARRAYPPYLRKLLASVDDSGRHGLTELLCANVIARINAPRFRKRLAQLQAQRAENEAPQTLETPQRA
ncbi:phosphoadenosine phosphosulfate reductase [Pseudogemmobacter sp. W21_MBD1_M6]|uniref:phosphoadenosine phosphosulfate reductase n=1 Tax=Pseudogemmobacter sp. W21_MBD1_M6 TaxID=3240271 RepID=UPI003F9DBEAC